MRYPAMKKRLTDRCVIDANRELDVVMGWLITLWFFTYIPSYGSTGKAGDDL
jgi:hypothetical protein